LGLLRSKVDQREFILLDFDSSGDVMCQNISLPQDFNYVEFGLNSHLMLASHPSVERIDRDCYVDDYAYYAGEDAEAIDEEAD